jgi:hypothetical protein
MTKPLLGILLITVHLMAPGLPDSDPAMPHNPGGGTGTTFHVATTGNDANPGTLAQPWRTILKAANTLTAGQTVLVRAGTYTETYQSPYKNIGITRSGSPGQYITYAAYPGERPVIWVSTWNGIEISGASYIEIRGFEIRGADDPADLATNAAAYKDDPVYFGGGITALGSSGIHHLRILDNQVNHVGRAHGQRQAPSRVRRIPGGDRRHGGGRGHRP